jgi:phage shock protein E
MKLTVIIIGVLVIMGIGFFVVNGNSSSSGSNNKSSQQVSIQANAVIYDVRTPQEFADSHAGGALNLPLQNLQQGAMPNVEKDSPVYVYCRSGSRSAQAATILKNAGYTNVVNIGGLNDIDTYGLTLTKG